MNKRSRLLLLTTLVTLFSAACGNSPTSDPVPTPDTTPSRQDNCTKHTDCDPKHGEYCILDDEGIRICSTTTKKPDGEPCQEGNECASNHCVKNDAFPEGWCSPECTTDDECINGDPKKVSKNVCLKSDIGSGPGYCVRTCKKDGDCAPTDSCHNYTYNKKKVKMCASRTFIGAHLKPGEEPQCRTIVGDDLLLYVLHLPEGVSSFTVQSWAPDSSAPPYATRVYETNSLQLLPLYDPKTQNVAINNLASTLSRVTNVFMLPMSKEQFKFVEPGLGYLYYKPSVKTLSRKLEVCAKLYVKEGEQAQLPESTIDLNVYLVGAKGLTAATAPDDYHLKEVFKELNDIYKDHNIQIGKVRFSDAPEDVKNRYRILREGPSSNPHANLRELLTHGKDISEEEDDQLSIDLFLVDSIQVGQAIGISGGIPGAVGLHGSNASGLVASMEHLFDDPTYDHVTNTITTGAKQIGSTIAHEMGHYLGLFHTTELSRSGQDPIKDTPTCSPKWIKPPEFKEINQCEDIYNLMFPVSSAFSRDLTAEQGFVLHSSSLIKPK